MERYTIDIRDEAAASLRDTAEARGISVEEEIRGLVERTVTAPVHNDWVHELIAMTRPGFEINAPCRLPHDRQVPWEYDGFS